MGTSSTAIAVESAECDLCHSSENKELYRKEVAGLTFAIVQCTVCKLVFLSPRPVSRDISRFYGGDYYSYQAPKRIEVDGGRSFGGRAKAHALRSLGYAQPASRAPLVRAAAPLVKQLLSVPKWKAGGRLLDIGCGTGQKLAYFQALGWKVVGLEISEEAAETGRKAGFDIRTEMIEDAPFFEDQFDAITLYHTLEHVYSPSRVLTQIRKWLKPGGEIVIVVPNFGCTERKIFGERWSWLDVPVHLYDFTPHTLKRLLDQATLSVEEMGYSAAGQSAEFPKCGIAPIDKAGRMILRAAGLACASMGDGKAIVARATKL